MKRRSKSLEKQRQAAEPGTNSLRIEMNSQALREIRQHARSSMSAEICGVLIGGVEGEKTIVDASIPGEEARQGGSHVTFTQETWTHIYSVKDSRFPDKRIVGWYHSHPGFGIFLSEHDTFIHRNFFSDPCQIAWVYDPHTDEEGCFAWEREAIKRITEMALRDEAREADGEEGSIPRELIGEESEREEPKPRDRRAHVARWVALILSHLFVLLLGFVAGALLAPQVIVIPDRNEPRPAISTPTNQPSPSASPEERKK